MLKRCSGVRTSSEKEEELERSLRSALRPALDIRVMPPLRVRRISGCCTEQFFISTTKVGTTHMIRMRLVLPTGCE